MTDKNEHPWWPDSKEAELQTLRVYTKKLREQLQKTRNEALWQSFIEMKAENERLKATLNDLKKGKLQ